MIQDGADYWVDAGRWWLSPAFDIVPNRDEVPTRLVMQTSLGSFGISRESLLADAHRFGFATGQAGAALEAFLQRVTTALTRLEDTVAPLVRDFLVWRIAAGVALLRSA